MTKNKTIQISLIFILLAIIILAAILLISRPRQAALTYEPSPENQVIYADIQPHPGGPSPDEPCPGHFFPRLRVWGDGLVFLDISQAGYTGPGQWSGRLTPGQIRSALLALNDNGFFSSFTPAGPNPAGTWFRFGANLRSKSVDFGSGDLEPSIYTQLIDQIKPNLQPLLIQDTTDPRILSILAENKACVP